jgi:hypothetical protein
MYHQAHNSTFDFWKILATRKLVTIQAVDVVEFL